MRVLLLCAAAFAGGILVGAAFWTSSATRGQRAPDGARDAADHARPWRTDAAEGDAPVAEAGSALVAELSRADGPLREVAGEAAAEVARILDRPAARALLKGSGTIAGTVRDEGGQPVPGVIVTVSPEAQPFDLQAAARRARIRSHEDVDLRAVTRTAIEGELWRREVRRTARTGADGRYEVKELPQGWQRVTAFHEEYDLRPNPANNRVQPDAVVDFVAQPVRSVPVEVRLPDGTLADNAFVLWQGPQGGGSDAWQQQPGTVRLPAAACRVRAQTYVPDPLQSEEVDYDPAAAGPLVLRLEGRRTLAAHLVPADGLVVPEGVEFRLRRLEGGADADPLSLKGDQARSGSQSQGRAVWYDLEPGRYLVAAFLGGRHLLASTVADTGEGSTDAGLPFHAPPAGTYVAARLLGPEGGPALGNARFSIVAGKRQDGTEALRCSDGTWLVLLPEASYDGEALLRVAVGGYGTAQETFDPRRGGSVTIRFRAPSRLRLVVDRYAGSGVEGRLFASLFGEEGAVASRQVEADGRCDLGEVQPKDFSLVLSVRDRDARWGILTRTVTLRGGEQEERVLMPALHTLRVRLAPELRSQEVTLVSSDPAIGWMRRVARAEGDVATFDALAAAVYDVRVGRKSVEARVPGSGEVAIQ